MGEDIDPVEVPPVQQGYTEEIQDEMHNMFTRVNPTVLRRSVRGARESSRLSQQGVYRGPLKTTYIGTDRQKADRVESSSAFETRVITLDDMEYPWSAWR
jgi:hypothetical protein